MCVGRLFHSFSLGIPMSTESTISVLVQHKSFVAEDICSFDLVHADGVTLPPFTAGAHIDVHLPWGLVRQYSLCNCPSENHRYQIGVLKDANSRGGSLAMHQRVQQGDVLKISTPRNNFPLIEGTRKSILLAGGIGITPLLSMAERLTSLNQDFELHYCTRSPQRTAFQLRISESPYAGRVKFHHDSGPAEQKLQLDHIFSQTQSGVHVYVCGPQGFIDAVLAAGKAHGWPEAQLHREYFSAKPNTLGAERAFMVKLASSGKTVLVEPQETLVQALSRVGVVVPTSCEQGVCGTCLVRVLEGAPDHRDTYLMPQEQAACDQMLPCCSRSKSELLVLDL